MSARPANATRALALAAAMLAIGGLPGRAQAQYAQIQYAQTQYAQTGPTVDGIIKALRPDGPAIRGIKPVSPSTAGDGANPVPPGSDPAVPSINLTVGFANNSAQLTPAAMRTLDTLGQALRSQDLAGYRFRIEGHTDTVGSRDRNKTLSEQRAAAVVDYLARRFGLDRAKLVPVGMGQDQPLVPGPANTPQPRNRRVTVVNLGV